jgi:hypothetical protein
MFFSCAHLLKCATLAMAAAMIAGRALGCGAMTGEATILEANERLEIKLADGRIARLAGLDVFSLARSRIAANWAQKPLKLALLAPRPDRWGRWLADFAAPAGQNLTDDLIDAGLARVKPEFETRGCEAAWLALETRARAKSAGIWDDPGSVYDAADVADLAAADAKLVIVEGRLRRIGATRTRFYLDFGGRGGFTVIVARKVGAAFQRRGVNLAALAGEKVRVRGYLDDRFGPRIELTDPLMIERTEGAGL